MQELWGFFNNLITQIGEYSVLFFTLTALLVVGLTQAIKVPIKKLTSLIKNDVARQKVNLIIMVIPFGFGVLINWGLSFIDGFVFDWQVGMSAGYLAEFVYCFLEKLLKRAKSGDEITDEVIKQATKESKKQADKKQKSFKELIEDIKF